MAASITHVLLQIQHWVSPHLSDLSDTALLERFIHSRDESAFAVLVSRHGDMVLRSCRRVLGDAHEAEDTFQATFLILARRAYTLRQSAALPGFLHRVARRVALKARSKVIVRAGDERLAEKVPDVSADPLARLTARELLTVFDEEIARLPMTQRAAVILCCVEGRTQEEAARLLGWTAGSLRGHLDRGRMRLQARLRRRGIALSAALAVVAVSRSEAASPLLLQSTVKAALHGGVGSASAVLAQSTLQTMFVSKLAGMTAVVLTIALAACVVVTWAYRVPVAEPPEDKTPPAPVARENAQAPRTLLTSPTTLGDSPRLDRYGDPLPPGVVARLGTQRLTLADTGSQLTFSPDGRRLATYDYPDQLRIWDVSSGKELLRIKQRPIRWHGRLVYSPDGKTLAMGYGDQAMGSGRLRVWEAATGKELHDFGSQFSQRVPSSICFSPDGRSLFAGGLGRPILCWDLAGSAKPRKIGDFDSAPYLALSRDGKTLTAGRDVGKDGKQWLFVRWDLTSGKKIGQQMLTTPVPGHGDLSPDGRIFARTEEDRKSVTLLDPMTGREIARARDCNPRGPFEFSADGTIMTCGNRDSTVRIWDTATGKVQTSFKALSTNIDRIALSADGKRVALTGRADQAIHVWDIAAGRELHSFIGHRAGPLAVAFLKDGKEVVTVSRDSSHVRPHVTEWAEWSFRRWDAATGAELAVMKSNPQGEVDYAIFSPDGRLLATVIHDGTLRLWSVESGKELRSWKVPTKRPIWDDGKGGKIITDPTLVIGVPVFTPDGKVLLTIHDSKILRWEVATSRELPSLAVEPVPHEQIPSWCAIAPDGQTLALHRWKDDPNGIYILVDAANGKTKQRLTKSRYGNGQPVFSPDGRTFAIQERGGGFSLWEVASGRPRGLLTESLSARALAFSPDGRFVAAGGSAFRNDPPLLVLLWDLATGQVAGRLRDDSGHVTSLAFSPDGSRLAVAGYFPTALVCDVAALCGKKRLEEIVKHATPSAEELETLWAELSGGDSVRAYRAIHRLALTGPRGTDFVKARLKGGKLPNEKRIARLIAELDDDQFATREKAFAELGKFGVRAEPALRRTLEGEVSAEVRWRVNRPLEALGTTPEPPPSPDLIRLRAVEALEANGSKEACQALAELAEQAADAQLKREAKASLHRLR